MTIGVSITASKNNGALSSNAIKQLDRFCRQYLQLQPQPAYPEKEYLRDETFQQSLHTSLFQEESIECPPPLRYQFRILKELIGRIENSIQDWEAESISEDLMSYFSSLVVSPIPSDLTAAQQKSYVTYTLSLFDRLDQAVPSITLLESRNLVAAAGTTGLRTWEAALFLGDYLCSHALLVKHKRVLELGAGTGYVSLLCAKLQAEHVLATDGSDDVVASLETNLYLNGLQDAGARVQAKKLKWGQALVGSEYPEWNEGRQIDVVLGADLTYDGSVVLALLATFGDLFDLFPKVQIIIAATIRNTSTFDTFWDRCRKGSFTVQKINFEIQPEILQEGPFYSNEVPIQICQISRPNSQVRNEDVRSLNGVWDYTKCFYGLKDETGAEVVCCRQLPSHRILRLNPETIRANALNCPTYKRGGDDFTTRVLHNFE